MPHAFIYSLQIILTREEKEKKGTRKKQKRGEKIRRKGLERKKRERAEGYFFYFDSFFFISRRKDNLRRVRAVGNGGERWFGNEERGDDEPRVLRPPRRARRTAVRAGAPSKSVPDCIIERE